MFVYESVDFMVASALLVFGLSCYLYPAVWIDWRAQLATQPLEGALKIGSSNLLIGTFILAFHWVWGGIETVVTVIGALFTIKGILQLLLPFWFTHKTRLSRSSIKTWMRVTSPLAFILAFLILYNLYMDVGIGDYLPETYSFDLAKLMSW